MPVNSSLLNHQIKKLLHLFECPKHSMCSQNLTPLGNLEFPTEFFYRNILYVCFKEGHTQKENKNLLLPGITQHLQVADLAFFLRNLWIIHGTNLWQMQLYQYKMLLTATYPHILGTNDKNIPDITVI